MEATAHAHDAAHSPEEMRKHVRKYMFVGGALLFLTVVTVAVSYLHLPTSKAIAVALAVATLKASMVAAVFMHLSAEKRIIYWCLALTAVFFIALMCLPNFTVFETYIPQSGGHATPLEGSHDIHEGSHTGG